MSGKGPHKFPGRKAYYALMYTLGGKPAGVFDSDCLGSYWICPLYHYLVHQKVILGGFKWAGC